MHPSARFQAGDIKRLRHLVNPAVQLDIRRTTQATHNLVVHHVCRKQRISPAAANRNVPQNLTPAIIGIYGVSGCGKSYLSEQLKKQLGETAFSFYEGSEQLMKTFNNTLADFRRLPEDGKNLIRASTIESISRDCVKTGKAGIVT